MILFYTSCEDYFEAVPEQNLTLEATFKSRALTLKYLANVYWYIPNEYNQRYIGGDSYGTNGVWTAGSIEGEYIWSFNQANQLNSGAFYPATDWVKTWWTTYYKGIHKANVFMSNIDNCQEFSEQERIRYKNEVRALRAFYYFWMFKIYGPFVIVGDNIFNPDSPIADMQLHRSSVEECIQYILDELEAVSDADILYSSFGQPNNPTALNTGSAGNITKEIVEAVRSQVLLYAASPLFNGDPYYSDLKNYDETPLFPQSEDRHKWELARDAAKQFIDNHPLYKLRLVDVDGRDVDDVAASCPYTSCRTAILGNNKATDTEMIFFRTTGINQYLYYDMTPKHTIGGIDGEYRGGGGLATTQEMVDLFFTNKGLRIEDDPDYYTYDEENPPSLRNIARVAAYRDPYSNRLYIDGTKNVMRQYYDREARFYLNITFNNQLWWFSSKSGNVYSEFNYNGNSGPANNGNDYPPTGLMVRKKRVDGPWASEGNYSILIRLAEIYLNYAEAANECGDLDEAIKYVNKIRARAGVAEYKGRTGEDATPNDARGNARIEIPFSQAEIRNLIRRERTVELAFENHRYFDVRRWNVAGMTQGDGWVYPTYHQGGEGGDTHGMNVMGDTNEFYKKVVFETRAFSEKMKLFPIPQADINRNPKMIQNKGWIAE
jgi:hypothetical protein